MISIEMDHNENEINNNNVEHPEVFLETLEQDLLDREYCDLSQLTAEEQYQIIKEKSGQHENSMIPAEGEKGDLLSSLQRSKDSGVPLRIKVGVDPTGKDMHIGHGITLRMLRRFQQMGHQIVLVIGEMTAMIGDSTDRSSARESLTAEQVRENMQTYMDQAARIIDLKNKDSVEVHYNSEWLNKELIEWMPILQQFSINRLLDRRDLQNRISTGKNINALELFYPIFMAEDSRVLEVDGEIGGFDQQLNFKETRGYMKKMGVNPEFIITVDLLPGTTGVKDNDGRLAKMSKSLGNYIAINEEPVSLYQKVFDIPDDIMWIWFREVTEITSEEMKRLQQYMNNGSLHPNVIHKMLARVVTANLNGGDMDIAYKAQLASERKFVDSVIEPEDTIVKSFKQEKGKQLTLKDVIYQLESSQFTSNSSINRLMKQGGVSVTIIDAETGEKIYRRITQDNLNLPIDPQGQMIKFGKKEYYKVVLE